jgi:hypothetical protein
MSRLDCLNFRFDSKNEHDMIKIRIHSTDLRIKVQFKY